MEGKIERWQDLHSDNQSGVIDEEDGRSFISPDRKERREELITVSVS